MGTSLTGLTPATTYDALIKVGDNGPLSATAKVLSDGLGNDSPLAMSTTNVGIGTTTPAYKLSVSGGSIGVLNSIFPALELYRDLDVTIVGTAGQGMYFGARNGSTPTAGAAILGALDNPATTGNLAFQTLTGGSLSTKMTITDTGNVGIGTSSPTSFGAGFTTLSVNNGTQGGIVELQSAGISSLRIACSTTDSALWEPRAVPTLFATNNTERMRITSDGYLRMASGTGGIQFNGDTAAANALDDYEEGTWTMGVSFGGGSTGVTYSTNTGRYTKIGNMVTVVGYLELSSKGTSFDAARITGLPFTIGSGNSNYAAPSLRLNRISFANQYTGFGEPNNTTIILVEQTEAGVETALNDTNFANNSEIILSFTYFV